MRSPVCCHAGADGVLGDGGVAGVLAPRAFKRPTSSPPGPTSARCQPARYPRRSGSSPNTTLGVATKRSLNSRGRSRPAAPSGRIPACRRWPPDPPAWPSPGGRPCRRRPAPRVCVTARAGPAPRTDRNPRRAPRTRRRSGFRRSFRLEKIGSASRRPFARFRFRERRRDAARAAPGSGSMRCANLPTHSPAVSAKLDRRRQPSGG